MTAYSKGAYGSNPLAGAALNADNGWGPYAWPDGVPAGKLKAVTYRGVTMVVRAELAPLVLLAMRVAWEKYNYHLVAGWCWSYENRPIGGTQRASNHSRARAMDWNAPNNGMGWTWQSDMPPGLVAFMASVGFYWGGYYRNQKTDPMHYEFVLRPDQVATCILRARRVLGLDLPSGGGSSTGGGKPQPAIVRFPLPVGYAYGRPNDPQMARAGVKKIVSSDPNIKLIQKRLIQRGYDCGPSGADGIFGPRTEAAVAKHQAKYGASAEVRRLKSGMVGPGTWGTIKPWLAA